MTKDNTHVCCDLCHLRGSVDFNAFSAGDPRHLVLDGKLLTQEEYYADPAHMCHVEVSQNDEG